MFLESPDLSRKFFEMCPQGFGCAVRVRVRVAVYVLETGGDNYLTQEALNQFHHYRDIFKDVGIHDNFNLP